MASSNSPRLIRARRPFLLWLAICGIVAVGPVAAEEILHFTNGTALPVRSYNVQDGMLYVDLGGDGFIAFPEYMVERIEGAGQDVRLPASNPDNELASRSTSKVVHNAEASYPVTGGPLRKRNRGPVSPAQRRANAEAEQGGPGGQPVERGYAGRNAAVASAGQGVLRRQGKGVGGLRRRGDRMQTTKAAGVNLPMREKVGLSMTGGGANTQGRDN